jgi:FixJ family two-component response regulator
MVLPLTVHVVEDDPAVREALGLVLTGEGYTVCEWEDGESFLAEATLSPSDLLLLDLKLPGLPGAGVAAALAARGLRPKTVVLSGQRGPDFDHAVRAIAPDAALRKPLRHDGLTSTLRALAGL